jgi:hypothetical protein
MITFLFLRLCRTHGEFVGVAVVRAPSREVADLKLVENGHDPKSFNEVNEIPEACAVIHTIPT